MPNATMPAACLRTLDLANRSVGVKTVAVAVGTLVLALSSHVEVPMVPVPVTMQSFAVTMIGALYGWRLGALTIVAWLLEGALGLPVLASGINGIARFVGPTAGYLFAFPLVGALVGWLAERGWNGCKPVLAFCAMLLGNGVCLAIGGLWLAILIGTDKAFALGVSPFFLGAVLKSALAAVLLMALHRSTLLGSRR